MPLHLIPQTRRQFLQTTFVGGTALLASRSVCDEDSESNTHRWALLADTHIAGDASATARGVTMFDNLNRIIDEVLAEQPRPAGVIINGDCAYLKGLAADYATLIKALQRLVTAGLPVHMTMGNHDDRGPFYHAFSDQRPDNPLVEGKHVSVLSLPEANLFLVDSLLEVNNATGELGGRQIDWLAKRWTPTTRSPRL